MQVRPTSISVLRVLLHNIEVIVAKYQMSGINTDMVVRRLIIYRIFELSDLTILSRQDNDVYSAELDRADLYIFACDIVAGPLR